MAFSFRSKSFVTFAAILVVTLIAVTDQLIKNFIVAEFEMYEVRPLLGEVVKLTYILNDSAAFSLGFGFTGLFTLISSVATLALICMGRWIHS
jgi:signal peptidase II